MTLRELLETLDIDTHFVQNWSDCDHDYSDSDLHSKRDLEIDFTLRVWEEQYYLDTKLKAVEVYQTLEMTPYIFMGLDYDDFVENAKHRKQARDKRLKGGK